MDPNSQAVKSFTKFIGIDYSGARTPEDPLSALEVYAADGSLPTRVAPPSAIWGWSRRELAAWLVDELQGDPVLVGIDHVFSFPTAYLRRRGYADWNAFLIGFNAEWHTADRGVTVRATLERHPIHAQDAHTLRLTERWTSSAKSVFDFNRGAGVAFQSHAGIPWLLFLREHPNLRRRLHFWPFDGFEIPRDRSVIAEVYPAIFKKRYPIEGRTNDQQDAYSIARWLADTSQRGALPRYLQPPLTDEEMALAHLEGWILGVA